MQKNNSKNVTTVMKYSDVQFENYVANFEFEIAKIKLANVVLKKVHQDPIQKFVVQQKVLDNKLHSSVLTNESEVKSNPETVLTKFIRSL